MEPNGGGYPNPGELGNDSMFDFFINAESSDLPPATSVAPLTNSNVGPGLSVNLDDFLGSQAGAMDINMASSFMTEPLASTATPRPVEAKPQVTVAPHETKPTTDDVATARPPLQLDYFDPTTFQFLPQAARVLDLIIKGGDRSEIARQAANLYQHLDDCEKIVQQLPGAEWSTHQQEVWLDRARTDLRRKTEQVEHYLALPVFRELESTEMMVDPQ